MTDNQDSARSPFPFDHLSQAEITEFEEELLPFAADGFGRGVPRAERSVRAKRFRELLARRYNPPPLEWCGPPRTPPEAA